MWDKRVDPKYYGTTTFSDCELAWTNIGNRALMYKQIWNGIIREGEEVARKNTGRSHPTQKPIRLMEWCIVNAGETKIILDPFAGSGSMLVAAKRLRRLAIGIEIEERYCEITAKRLLQSEMQFE